MSIFNWYILGDLLCGDLCLVTMRHNEYISEKNTYKTPEYIQKRDQKWRKKQPLAYRFHEFVQISVLSITNKNIATIIRNGREQQIVLQNMDGFFYFNETRKKKQEEKIDKIDKNRIGVKNNIKNIIEPSI
jgi:endo-alpha-1,4-polygalactosaminidase (GH114 family)